MARMQGITGGLSGKMGSAVFRQSRGQTVAAQYQPIVKNPNTEGQQTQRAKFKLMSQLAAIMAPGFGTLGTVKRGGHSAPSQRNAFTSLNFPLVTVDSQGEEVTAKIDMSQLQLTSSFRYLPKPTASFRDGVVHVNLEQVPAEVASVRFVTVGYVGGVASIVDLRDVPVPASRIISEDTDPVQGTEFTVLAYGLIPSETANTNISLDNIHTPADEDFISAVELNAMVADGQLAETITVGVNVSAS